MYPENYKILILNSLINMQHKIGIPKSPVNYKPLSTIKKNKGNYVQKELPPEIDITLEKDCEDKITEEGMKKNNIIFYNYAIFYYFL